MPSSSANEIKPGMPMTGKRRFAFNQLNERIYNGTYHLVTVDRCYCGAQNLEPLTRFDRFGLPFGTRICSKCGLITLDRMLSEADWESFYNEIYWPLIGGTAPTFQTAQDDFNDFLTFIKPQIRDDVKIIMEVGCGSGVRLELIRAATKSSAVRLIGADYSDAALEIVRTKNIEPIKGGMEALKQVGKADILILSHVFEHMPNLRQTLKDISDLTHSNSIIYVEVPGVVDLENKKEYGYDYQDYCVLAHIHNFSLATLTNVFRESGFGLVCGNEYVRAVFRGHISNAQAVNDAPYDQIMAALKRAKMRSNKHDQSIVRRIKRTLSVARDHFWATTSRQACS